MALAIIEGKALKNKAKLGLKPQTNFGNSKGKPIPLGQPPPVAFMQVPS